MHPIAPVLAFAVLALNIGCSTTARLPHRDPDFEKLEARLDRLRARWNVPGMAAGVSKGSRIVWTNGFGFADLSTKQPVTPDTVFHLASLTKPFAAVVLLPVQIQLTVETSRRNPPAPDLGNRTESIDGVRVIWNVGSESRMVSHCAEPGSEERWNRTVWSVASGLSGT